MTLNIDKMREEMNASVPRTTNYDAHISVLELVQIDMSQFDDVGAYLARIRALSFKLDKWEIELPDFIYISITLNGLKHSHPIWYDRWASELGHREIKFSEIRDDIWRLSLEEDYTRKKEARGACDKCGRS